jgi:hypothetical protein
MPVSMGEVGSYTRLGFSSPMWQSKLPGWAQDSDKTSILSLLSGLFLGFDSHRAGLQEDKKYHLEVSLKSTSITNPEPVLGTHIAPHPHNFNSLSAFLNANASISSLLNTPSLANSSTNPHPSVVSSNG